VVSNNQKQKGESQNVSRGTTSLPYMAIYRVERDRYCTQRLEKHGRIAIKLLLLFICTTKKYKINTKK